ncbi:MAG: hypothetical protein HYZ18_05565 [Pseudogulbenkiania sp.]|nr:hypothetical protein [Pseudogulbenkiania sp.]
MKLKNVSKFFDRTPAVDGYTGLNAFKCQLEPFDYVKIDGAAVKRRVMSTAPEVVIPTRKVISIDGQRYLVGDSSPDHWNGETVRNRYVIQGADDSVQIQSIAQVLANTAGTTAYASIEFNKVSTDERDNSDFHPQYHIYFGPTESVPKHSVLTAGSKTYLVREAHPTLGGLLDALSNELDSPVIDAATFKSRSYNPVTDTYTDTPATVRCMRVRWQDHFTYLSQGSTKYESGDMQVFVPTSVTPKAGDTLTLTDGVWTLLSVVAESTFRSLHVRRA